MKMLALNLHDFKNAIISGNNLDTTSFLESVECDDFTCNSSEAINILLLFMLFTNDEGLLVRLLNKPIFNVFSISDPISLNLPGEIMKSFPSGLIQQEMIQNIIINQLVFPKQVKVLDNGNIQVVEGAMAPMYNAFIYILNNADKLDILQFDKNLCAANSSELIFYINKRFPDELIEASPSLYEKAFTMSSNDVVKALISLRMPTLLDKIKDSPLSYINNFEITQVKSIALFFIIHATLEELVNNIDTTEKALLFLELRDVSPIEALSYAKRNITRKTLLALL